MRRLSETHLFNIKPTSNFKDEIKKINLEMERIPVEALEDDIKIISRRFNYSLKSKVLDDFNNNKIIALYPEQNNLTQLIPIYQQVLNKDIVSIFNYRLYGTRDNNNNFTMDNRKLYALMECAYIDRQLFLSEGKLLNNMKVLDYLTKIYVKLMNKVFDKLFGINLQLEKADQLNFLLGKFFLIYVLGRANNDTTDSLAYNTIFNDTPKQMLTSMSLTFSDSNFESLEGFFVALRDNFEGLKGLNFRIFLQNYLRMYGQTAALSIEYLPSLLENVLCGAVFGIRINRDFMYDSVVGNEALKLHTEICRILA